MILMLDQSSHDAQSTTVIRRAPAAPRSSAPTAFDDWRGVEPRLARTLRRLGFSAALAAPRDAGASAAPPARRADATAPEWRPL